MTRRRRGKTNSNTETGLQVTTFGELVRREQPPADDVLLDMFVTQSSGWYNELHDNSCDDNRRDLVWEGKETWGDIHNRWGGAKKTSVCYRCVMREDENHDWPWLYAFLRVLLGGEIHSEIERFVALAFHIEQRYPEHAGAWMRWLAKQIQRADCESQENVASAKNRIPDWAAYDDNGFLEALRQAGRKELYWQDTEPMVLFVDARTGDLGCEEASCGVHLYGPRTEGVELRMSGVTPKRLWAPSSFDVHVELDSVLYQEALLHNQIDTLLKLSYQLYQESNGGVSGPQDLDWDSRHNDLDHQQKKLSEILKENVETARLVLNLDRG